MKNNENPPFLIRPISLDDLPFLYHSFLRTIERASSTDRRNKPLFIAAHHALLSSWIESPKAHILIACTEEDTDLILGYSILAPEHNAVLFSYVKSDCREHGISKILANAALDIDVPMAFCISTGIGSRIADAHSMQYTPKILQNIST